MDHLRLETRRVLTVLQADAGWLEASAMYEQAGLLAPVPEDAQSRVATVTQALRELDEAGYPVEWRCDGGWDFYRLATPLVVPSVIDMSNFY
jgi:hypothetical protein